MLFVLILGHFFVFSINLRDFLVVTLVNLKIIQKNFQNPQKIQKTPKKVLKQ